MRFISKRVIATERDTREVSTCAENQSHVRIQPKLEVRHLQLESLETNSDGSVFRTCNLLSLWDFLRSTAQQYSGSSGTLKNLTGKTESLLSMLVDPSVPLVSGHMLSSPIRSDQMSSLASSSNIPTYQLLPSCPNPYS